MVGSQSLILPSPPCGTALSRGARSSRQPGGPPRARLCRESKCERRVPFPLQLELLCVCFSVVFGLIHKWLLVVRVLYLALVHLVCVGVVPQQCPARLPCLFNGRWVSRCLSLPHSPRKSLLGRIYIMSVFCYKQGYSPYFTVCKIFYFFMRICGCIF